MTKHVDLDVEHHFKQTFSPHLYPVLNLGHVDHIYLNHMYRSWKHLASRHTKNNNTVRLLSASTNVLQHCNILISESHVCVYYALSTKSLYIRQSVHKIFAVSFKIRHETAFRESLKKNPRVELFSVMCKQNLTVTRIFPAKVHNSINMCTALFLFPDRYLIFSPLTS